MTQIKSGHGWYFKRYDIYLLFFKSYHPHNEIPGKLVGMLCYVFMECFGTWAW